MQNGKIIQVMYKVVLRSPDLPDRVCRPCVVISINALCIVISEFLLYFCFLILLAGIGTLCGSFRR